MEIEKFAKRFADRETEAHRLAVEAIAKTVGAPGFQSLFEQQSRMAAEAVQSLIRGSEFSAFHNATITAVRKAAEQATALLCNPHTAPNFQSQIQSLVTGIERNAFAELTADVLKRHDQESRKLTEQLVGHVKPRSFHFERLTIPRFDRNWTSPHIPLAVAEPPESGTQEFMRQLQEHLDAAAREAEESGGVRIVRCKTPAGEQISVTQLSCRDGHFISVAGIDQFSQLHEFTGHHSAIAITIEVIPRAEEEEQGQEDDEPIN